MILSIDACNDILDALMEEFPEELFQSLNGGILLLEEALPDPEAGEDVYIMGEYCWDELGRYINIYYGSFAALLCDEPEEVWEDELRITLRHELTHHVEGLAGERSLEYKDSAQLEALRSGADWPEDEV
ncbi:MAG: metallopeptidase family protein [Candidatus Enterenecus sp.]